MSEYQWTVILRRMLFAATVFVLIAAGTFVPSSRGAESSEPEEYIFRVLMPPQWTIADAIFAYQFRGSYYLPIVELAEAYEFFVEAETDRAFVKGFAGREENTFTIDGERGELIVRGESRELPVDALLESEFIGEDDIYVQLAVLNEIWPVEMRVELSSLTVVAEPEEELSFVRRVQREDRRTIFESRQELKGEIPDLPYRENPYRWFGKPVLDLQSSFTFDNSQKVLTGTNNMSGSQQLGKFMADYSASYAYLEGKLRRPESIRARFMRQAVGEEDLLIPTLKRVEFGDINLSQRSLVGSNAGGRGVVVSNSPSVKTREFDRITVEGTGPPGWELELYNNTELLRFSVIEPDGEYRFEDVVLNFGNNVIRVIMYGPQGQVREVVEEHQVAGSLLTPGEFRYRAGFADTGRPFIRLEEPEPGEEDPIVTQNGEFSYGLNQWLTLFGSYTKTPFNQDVEQYYTGGFAFGSPVGVGEVEGYRQINGGSAVDMRFLTQLFGVRLNLRSAFFSKFESQDAGTGTSAKRFEGEMQANTTIPLPFMPISFRLNTLHRELRDGTVTTEIDTGQSFTGGGLRFGHGTNSRFVDQVHQTSSGDFNVTWNKGNWQTRGAFNYAIHPLAELTSGTAEIRYNPRTDFQAALNFQHNFPESISGIGAQIGYDFEDILTSFDTQYLQERGWQFIMRASTSLNPYYPDRSYRLSSTSRRAYAPILGRVFLDRDANGAFTEGDEPIENARLQVGRSRSVEKTDKDGFVVVPARPDELTPIMVDEASLQDPYFQPGVEGYSTVGLRGSMPGFDFPVLETGAIDGTVWGDPSGKPVPGMILQLVREDGEIYMTTETAFDGYYAFEFVLPGTYTVRADPSYQVNVPAETVTVSSEELFAFGADLYLLEPAAEEDAADLTDGESGGIAQLPTTAPAVPGTEQPAPASPPDGGSSPGAEETSDEDSTLIEESHDDGGSYPVIGDIPNGGASSVVKDVRIGEHPDKVRLVLDLSAPISYQIEEGDEGLIVLVDLPGAQWQAQASEDLKYSMVLKGFETEALPGGGMRMILRARDRIKVKHDEILPAAGDQGPRLVIDLARK